MIEVIYLKPEDPDHERGISELASLYRGVVSCREDDWGQTQQAICLTIEFWNWEDAETACAAFREIFEISLASYTVLGSLTNKNLRPRVNPARSVVLRIPLLVAIGQSSVAETELRRFVELIL